MTIPRPEVNHFSLTKHIVLEYLDSKSTNIVLEYLDSKSTNLDFQSEFFICIYWEVWAPMFQNNISKFHLLLSVPTIPTLFCDLLLKVAT